jgi:hypothetical protein
MPLDPPEELLLVPPEEELDVPPELEPPLELPPEEDEPPELDADFPPDELPPLEAPGLTSSVETDPCSEEHATEKPTDNRMTMIRM